MGFRVGAKASQARRRHTAVDRLRVGRGAARAEDAQGTPTQSHISPSILTTKIMEGDAAIAVDGWRRSCVDHMCGSLG